MNNQDRGCEHAISRQPGNMTEEEYEYAIRLAHRDPPAAMRWGLKEPEDDDGGSYMYPSCIMAVAIGYAHFLAQSFEEQAVVLEDERWEGYPPNMRDPLMVALRMRCRAWRTKTTRYEKARVYNVAIGPAFRQGIQPYQVREFLQRHTLSALYERNIDRSTHTGLEPDAEHDDADESIESEGDASSPVHTQSTNIENGDDRSSSPPLPFDHPSCTPSSQSTERRRARGRYADDVSEYFELAVLIPLNYFDEVLVDQPDEFFLCCRFAPNGDLKWKRVNGWLAS